MKLKIPSSKQWIAAVSAALLCSGLGLVCLKYFMGAGLRNLSYDYLQVLRGDREASEAVLVCLDETSHQHLGQDLNKAWDRMLHAKLIERLSRAGAKAIVFDIVFSDANPDKKEADDALAAAIKKSGRVILAADNVARGPKRNEMVLPHEQFQDGAGAIGSDEVTASSDMVVRLQTREDQLPSLSWAAAEFLHAPTTKRKDLRNKELWLNYYGPPNFLPSLSYHKALDPAVSPDSLFKDKVVFVGARIMTRFAGDRKDEYLSPFSHWTERGKDNHFISGVEVQATSFLNLMRGDVLLRPGKVVEQVIVCVFGVAIALILLRSRPLNALTISAGAAVLVVVSAYFLFARFLVWFPFLILLVQVFVALAFSVVHNSIQLYVQRKLLEHTLQLILPPKLVHKYASRPDLLKPGAEKQVLSILFSDIQDFTSISEGMDSDDLAKLMNSYFETAVSQCIHYTDGTIVKYLGDSIFAFWNAPEPHHDHALRACEAALLFRSLPPVYGNGRPLHTRLGIHTGVANVGNFGSAKRVDYTALGESINLASRMEGLNKHLGTRVLITGETRHLIGDAFVTRYLGLFQLKGFGKPVEAYELISTPQEVEATRAWRESFAAAHQLFLARDFKRAEEGFRATLLLQKEDGPSRFYLAHIVELKQEALPENWRGVIELKEK
ncbi:MAG: hypothetical protein JWM16_3158 [Verrucomicrobiales bacterium]|nr:hypothetical protein [Verrucomicrobiales bacterium]